ncbi:aldolase [Mycena rebaudengoi]|nr:aldolase [Mycena rebaudengoi]
MSSSTTLLAQVREFLTVDVDSMDPDVAAQYDKFCDMTCNQAIVHGQAVRPERRGLLAAAVEYAQKHYQTQGEEFEQDVVDVLTVLLAKEVYPHITGNVHAQTSPSAAYDTEKTIEHARKLVALFEEHGIPQQRVCIKIPATPESLLACRQLAVGGVQTLATCLFSVPQAVAASQANCTYVAPYFNELRVHFQPSLWKEYADTKLEHPMSPVILSIVQEFRQLVSKTQVMPARFVIALVSLGPTHLTLSPSVLAALASAPRIAPEAFVTPTMPTEPSALAINYLGNGGALLREALAGDPEVQRKLADALAIFGEKEGETRGLVRDFMSSTVS